MDRHEKTLVFAFALVTATVWAVAFNLFFIAVSPGRQGESLLGALSQSVAIAPDSGGKAEKNPTPPSTPSKSSAKPATTPQPGASVQPKGGGAASTSVVPPASAEPVTPATSSELANAKPPPVAALQSGKVAEVGGQDVIIATTVPAEAQQPVAGGDAGRGITPHVIEASRVLPPKITALSPERGPVGTTIVVSGRGFSKTGNKIFVRGNIIVSDLSSADGTSLSFALPSDIACGVGEACPIKVITSNGISNAVPFKITEAGAALPPTISQEVCGASAPRPSGYITYDSCADLNPVMLRRHSGDLVVLFHSLGVAASLPRVSISHDNGLTWSLPQPTNKIEQNYPGQQYAITEDSGGILFLATNANADNKSGVFVLTSRDGLTWEKKSYVTPNGQADSILLAKDGYYYVGYWNYVYSTNPEIEGAVIGRTVFLTRSKDLVTWEEPINFADVLGGNVDLRDSALLQTPDGTLWFAADHQVRKTAERKGTVIMKSLDGKNWTQSGFVEGIRQNSGSERLVQIGGKLAIFGRGAADAGLYYSFLQDNGAWSAPQKVLDTFATGADPEELADGTIGITYDYIVNSPILAGSTQYDIRFANLGKLDLGVAAVLSPPPPSTATTTPPAPMLPTPCDTSWSRPAGYITYDTCSDQEPAVIRRANGDLVTIFNSGGNNLAVSRGAVSRDNGATWSVPQFAVNAWDDLSITEGPNGELVLLSWATTGGGIGLETHTSTDGLTWGNTRKVTPAEINNSVGDIIWAKDGYYYAAYHSSSFLSGSARVQDTLITRSKDLSVWEAPVNVTNGTVYSNDASLLQTSDGTFWLAYNLIYSPGGTEIMKSADGKTWTRAANVPNIGGNHGAVNLIEYNGKPVVFGRLGYSTYYSYRLDTGAWSQPQKILDNTPFGGEAVVLADGTVGIVHTYIANLTTDPYGQRDIRFANIGAIAVGTATTTTAAACPPTVSLKADTLSVAAGQPFNLNVSGASCVGLAGVWWFGTSTAVTGANVVSSYPATPTSSSWFTTPVTNPTKLDRAFGSPLFSAAQAVKEYTFSSTVTISTPGAYTFGANSRDVLYPVAGEPHQASEGAGMASVNVTVVQAVSLPPVPTSSVNVLSPNGGETWMQQTKPLIKWSASNVVGKTVTVNLLKGGAFYRTIAALAPQSTETGSFSYAWAVSTDVPQGSDYQIEIVNAGDANVRDVSDGTFTIVPMPDVITIRGRVIDYFTRQPVANTSIRSFRTTNGTSVVTGPDGTFAAFASTAPITATSSQAWYTQRSCYLSLGNGFSVIRPPLSGYYTNLGPQPENSLWVSVNPFDAIRAEKYFAVLGPEVDIGDHVIWPVADTFYFHSDVALKYMVEYPEEGRGAGYGLLTTSGASSGLIPLGYNVRVRLTDASNQTFYSPYTKLPLSHGCNPIALKYSGGQFSWEPLAFSVTTPNGGESWPAGITQTITWKASGLSFGALANIQLRDGLNPATWFATLSTTTPASSNSFNWSIPATQRPGSYRIWIQPTGGSGVLYFNHIQALTDLSDAPFNVTAP
ncbi:MAG: hypothetical protein A3B37_01955 [Candidatus Sungbacteria bacterium RIFCSPLOWO2_01_FULL_59_16]|uniref:Yeast cell wall synthesis Kre9/Knh1-like N-terminal domain-containing protein n=1 Tax=Candidatus Sungbacteria bacterium RIFCSPLOWO2_01_FULL_59_16 TaxID=1802280 RepID=A0A1G2LCT1_9BACT|nr:MAG: hypothetical protein A3B37_01955 [Candidatus Sungbacteria bacterium RIFCSPLOWO2_01_FULL_59_16]